MSMLHADVNAMSPKGFGGAPEALRPVTPTDLRAAVERLATPNSPIVTSALVREEFSRQGLDAGERSSDSPKKWNGPHFQRADNTETRAGRLLKWKHSDGRGIAWSPVPTSAPQRARLANRARDAKWLLHPDSAAADPVVQQGTSAALAVPTRLAAILPTPAGWTKVSLEFAPPAAGDDQYGSVAVFTAENLDFRIWLDRSALVGELDLPILCAAFGTYGRLSFAAAEALAARREDYEYGGSDRAHGFNGDPVLERPANRARFLSSYRPAGDYDVDAACDQFEGFFHDWLCEFIDIKQPDLNVTAGSAPMAVLRGLVGELAVLASKGMENAHWVGPRVASHDIVNEGQQIEVKTRGRSQAATVSLSQLRASARTNHLFALVDLPPGIDELFAAGKPPSRGGLHPVVVKHLEEIDRYLARQGIQVDRNLHIGLSEAIGRARDCISFHRARVPEGFWETVENLEGFGRIRDLAIECGPHWFVPV
jgi:hypothetical protein